LLYATGSLHYRTSRVNDIDALIINFLLVFMLNYCLLKKLLRILGEANKKASSDEEALEIDFRSYILTSHIRDGFASPS